MQVMSLIEAIGDRIRADGWENVILGLGGQKDPSAYTTYSSRAKLNDALLEALYVEDHFAARIIEALPKHGLRPGWQLQLPGDPAAAADAKDAYAAFEDDMAVVAELSQGAVWGRTFGGSLTWVGADDGREPSLPLDEDAIQTVKFFHTFDRRDVHVWRYYTDPSHPKFRRPEVYRIVPRVVVGPDSSGSDMMPALAGQGAFVHESRCIVWPGVPTTDERRLQLVGWDDSVLERCWDALRQAGEDYGAKSQLLGRISQAIYKFKGLYAMLAGKQKEILQARLDLLERSRSRARAIALDIEEDFVNVTQPVSGVDTLIDKSILRLAAAAEMPVAVLMGQPLSTLEGTNDGDLEVWDQEVEAWRKHVLRPRHERIAQMILLSKDGPTGGVEPDQWRIEYMPLRQPKPKERAEVRKLEAETDAIRVDKGFATPEAIALARFSPAAGGDLVLDEAELRARLERRRELDAQPPKDNAELGTVGARSGAAIEIVKQVTTGQIPRESGRALLIELFRFQEKIADQILGPPDFTPSPVVAPGKPGPDPDPRRGEGAGAPQGLPGFNDGGDPNAAPPIPGEDGEG